MLIYQLIYTNTRFHDLFSGVTLGMSLCMHFSVLSVLIIGFASDSLSMLVNGAEVRRMEELFRVRE